MKKTTTLLTFLLLIPVVFTGLNSCKKETHNPADDYSITVFANQTGSPGADALQAQLTNTAEHYQINFYGTYINDNTPGSCSTVTFKRDGNDTTVTLIMDPASHRLQTAYLDVNGTKQPWVIKHSYISGNDSAVVISIYDYNWATNTGTLKFESTFENQNGIHTEFPSYGSFKTNDWFDFGAVAAGFVIAEAAFYGTGIGFLGTAAGAALVGAAGTIVAVGGTIAIVIGGIAILTSNANAADLEPGNNPYPNNAPVLNPATGTSDPVERSLCVCGWS